ncbi:hypothetical protein FHS42_004392 [Streptomyces zagrosensis]|uniref:Uncharacterized protein n=1 Tax=Streptomyces zagrosensis TaxID=1042984 RepID=A0A7W9QBQ4_9ACTN|nr:hypothetical protein [Streptomyces zagrosensis]
MTVAAAAHRRISQPARLRRFVVHHDWPIMISLPLSASAEAMAMIASPALRCGSDAMVSRQCA